jgi:hypothetical protein
MKPLRSAGRAAGVATATVVLFCALRAVAAPSSPTAADAILGRWKYPDDDLVVELVKRGAGYVGKIVRWADNPRLVGTELLRAVTFDREHAEWRGELFAVRRRRFVPMRARIDARGALFMTAGSRLFSKELTWVRP